MSGAPRLVFEDKHLLVISKPAGLLAQGEITGDENLVDWLRAYLGRPYVGLVHRLDRNTSGLMVVAKRTKSAQRLTDSLQSGELERRYLAWLEGTLTAPATWTHFLVKDEKTNTTRAHAREVNGSKKAVLSVTPRETSKLRGQPVTLAEFRLETGRSHQIRAQASVERFPLVGDAKYGAAASGFTRPALHSFYISFPHPMTEERLNFEEPLPEDMEKLRIPT